MKSIMEKEIYSQSAVLRAIEANYIKENSINICDIDFDFDEVKFIASGSSYNACRLGAKFFEYYTTKRVSFEYASEFISNSNRFIKKNTLYVFMSQSGETYDTKCALDIVKNEGGKTLAIVNNTASVIYNAADYKIDMLAGKENSIAATKSFLSGVICLWLFALSYSASLEKNKLKAELDDSILAIDETLFNSEKLNSAAEFLSKKKKLSIIGYNYGYILAKEGALKIKETSYIDTSAYPTGEFLHGHTAVLNKNKTLIQIFTKDFSQFEENTLNKIKNDFNPDIVAITDKNIELKRAVIFGNYSCDIAKICAITVILQLLALKIALITGADVDKPKGLRKVVF